MMYNGYRLKWVRDHYLIYNLANQFIGSADTKEEAIRLIREDEEELD